MARTKRHELGGTWHHVMNRGARHLPVFGGERDRRHFVRLLGEVTEASLANVHAYALMPNHFHLLIEAPVAELADAMRRLSARYTRWFNDRYGYDGPLFRGRYRSKPVEAERYLRQVVRYIHRNPLDPQSPDVEQLYWTSHPAYVGLAARPSWLTTSAILSGFGNDASAFDAFVLDGSRPGAPTPIRPSRVRTVSPVDVELALGVESDREREVLRAGGRGVRNDLRLAALVLGHRHTSAGVERLARRYGYADAHTARSAIARAKARLERDEQFRCLMSAAEARLVALVEKVPGSDPRKCA